MPLGTTSKYAVHIRLKHRISSKLLTRNRTKSTDVRTCKIPIDAHTFLNKQRNNTKRLPPKSKNGSSQLPSHALGSATLKKYYGCQLRSPVRSMQQGAKGLRHKRFTTEYRVHFARWMRSMRYPCGGCMRYPCGDPCGGSMRYSCGGCGDARWMRGSMRGSMRLSITRVLY